ncbi:hypothetical protein niasHS_000694 [Heterodera schachtii]|uniref:Kinesin-like protein n=1 Tax=Heterodera schachtii TaxID=97005 RepID=A0ABD2KAY1_HETSC
MKKKIAKLIKSNSSVRVAVRIRPQSVQEMHDKVPICLSVIPGEPQLTIGRDKSFTYDFVFDQMTPQKTVYDKCVRELVDGAFEGYNATVFAYGQTGSGKTFTMGTSLEADPAKRGIIPNAAQQIFDEIEERREQARRSGKVIPSFEVSAQFIELYNEELIDLLSSTDRDSSSIKIKEDPTSHEILLLGASSRNVTSQADILSALATGAQNRTTAATNMNKQSSRSHAIFTVNIKQTRVAVPVEDDSEEKENTADDDDGDEDSSEKMSTGTELETLHAKFHFIDLAGSERLSRTGATGDRVKESISINSGLLALGNVISALGGAKGRIGAVHVPYRDSKLTRLLQDSLGGNSRTLMITCVSPNEIDAIETLSSLNYANRAKNIKNKVVANQNKINALLTAPPSVDIAKWEAWNRELDAHLGTNLPEMADPIIQLPSLGAPDDVEAVIRAREEFTKQLARFRGFEKAEQQNVKLYDAKLRQRLCVADIDRERVQSLEDELGKVKTELTVQGRENRQLKRKYAALETRVREYETELENGREQMERAKRYIDQEKRPEKDARRTLLKLAEMFESPIPTTSNVARLRKQFDDDDNNDADDN